MVAPRQRDEAQPWAARTDASPPGDDLVFMREARDAYVDESGPCRPLVLDIGGWGRIFRARCPRHGWVGYLRHVPSGAALDPEDVVVAKAQAQADADVHEVTGT